MDNTPDLGQAPSLEPPAGMEEMRQEPTPQEQVPDTTEEAKAETADVVAEQTETPKEETPQEDKVEESKEFQMPEKFAGKSAEEIAKSYTELETHNKKVEMDKAEIDKFVKEAYSPEPQETPEVPVETKEGEEAPLTREQALKQVADELAPRLKQDMESILTPLSIRLEAKELIDEFGNSFKAVASKVAAAKKENPSLSLRDHYKLITYENVARISEIKGIKQASQTAGEKLKAQVESSKPSGLKPVGIEDAVADPNVGVGEIAEALGPEYDSFKETSKRRARK